MNPHAPQGRSTLLEPFHSTPRPSIPLQTPQFPLQILSPKEQTNKQTNVTHIHGPVAAVNAHTLKASGSVTQLESQLL